MLVFVTIGFSKARRLFCLLLLSGQCCRVCDGVKFSFSARACVHFSCPRVHCGRHHRPLCLAVLASGFNEPLLNQKFSLGVLPAFAVSVCPSGRLIWRGTKTGLPPRPLSCLSAHILLTTLSWWNGAYFWLLLLQCVHLHHTHNKHR